MKIDDIKGETFILGLLDLVFLIAPGIAVIFLQDSTLLLSMDWIKLIFISVAIVSPTAFLLMTLFFVREAIKENRYELFPVFSFGLIGNGITIYFILALNYFYPKPLYQYFILIAVVYLVCILFSLIKLRKHNK